LYHLITVTVLFCNPLIHSYCSGSFWLRDHCKCPECWHPSTKQRLFETFSVPLNIPMINTETSGSIIRISWPDGHKSEYDIEWLKRHAFDSKVISKLPGNHKKRELWNCTIKNHSKFPRVTYEEVMRGNVGLSKWLSLLVK
jgi:trimethyllysine dioxygenase